MTEQNIAISNHSLEERLEYSKGDQVEHPVLEKCLLKSHKAESPARKRKHGLSMDWARSLSPKSLDDILSHSRSPHSISLRVSKLLLTDNNQVRTSTSCLLQQASETEGMAGSQTSDVDVYMPPRKKGCRRFHRRNSFVVPSTSGAGPGAFPGLFGLCLDDVTRNEVRGVLHPKTLLLDEDDTFPPQSLAAQLLTRKNRSAL